MTATNLVSLDQAKAMLAEKPKRSKFGNVKAVYDGETFDSRGELERWKELKLLEKAGEISNLERQVRFPLVVRNSVNARFHVCDYVADFVYWENIKLPGGFSTKKVVEDFKSAPTRTREYLLKKKLLLISHGITILETGAKATR